MCNDEVISIFEGFSPRIALGFVLTEEFDSMEGLKCLLNGNLSVHFTSLSRRYCEFVIFFSTHIYAYKLTAFADY